MADGIDDLMNAVRRFVAGQYPGEQASDVQIGFASGRKPFASSVPTAPIAKAPEETIEPQPRYAKLRRAIFKVLEESGKRMTLSQIQDAVAIIDVRYSDRHLKSVLSDLSDDDFIDNGTDERGTGYGLIDWPGGSQT